MKDQYVGDVNDFCKYALLRELSGAIEGRLVVAWMLTAADGRTDGRHLSYLQRPETYRSPDPELFDQLACLLESGERSVAAVEAADILPGARFHSDRLDGSQQRRGEWFAKLAASVRPRDLVFFDPDNGLAVSSVPPGRRDSCKYLYWQELRKMLALGGTVCVYQHFPRRERVAYLRDLSERIRALNDRVDVHAVGSSRVAFILAGSQPMFGRLTDAAHRVVERLPGVLRSYS
jgi:hypothetical protein